MASSQLLDDNVNSCVECEDGAGVAAVEDKVSTGEEDLPWGGQSRHRRRLRGHEDRAWGFILRLDLEAFRNEAVPRGSQVRGEGRKWELDVESDEQYNPGVSGLP